MSLQTVVTARDDTVVIRLVGELDMSTVGTLRDAVHVHLPGPAGRLVLDLAELTFCDSLGLGTLLVLSRTARAQRTLLVLSRPGRHFRAWWRSPESPPASRSPPTRSPPEARPTGPEAPAAGSSKHARGRATLAREGGSANDA